MAAGEAPTGRQAALAALLASAVDGVVQAQALLDRDALQRLTQYIDTPQGGITLPPLWYTVADAAIDIEAAATVTRLDARRGGAVRLGARLLNPAAVSLFGYQASSGLKVALRLTPREAGGALPPRPATDPPA
jgi:hypothetical protein